MVAKGAAEEVAEEEVAVALMVPASRMDTLSTVMAMALPAKGMVMAQRPDPAKALAME